MKKKFTLYLGIDQMALAGRLAEKSGKSLSALVGESMQYLFHELGLDVPPPEMTELESAAIAEREKHEGLAETKRNAP